MSYYYQISGTDRYPGYSDLSYYLQERVLACTAEARKFTGKKLSEKLWNKTRQWKKVWIINSLLRDHSRHTGIPKKLRLQLLKQIRNNQINFWNLRCKKLPHCYQDKIQANRL